MQARRTLGVWHVWVIILVALVVGCLLGAVPLHERARAMDSSAFRTAVLAVTGPLATASDFLRLDRPWEWATGRSGEEEASTDTATGTTGVSSTVGTSTTLVSGAVGPTTTHSTLTTSTTTTTLPLFSAETPLRLLVVGDSLVTPIGYGLKSQSEGLPALKVKVITKVSSGLVRPDFFDWPQTLAEAVAEFHPHVTVMLFGGNEKQTMLYQGRSLEPFSEEWTAEYSKRVEGAIDITTTASGQVVWIGMPIMRGAKFSATVRKLNAIYSEVCSRHPATTYIDGYSLFADDQGEYSAYLVDSSGKRRLMRDSDGIHLTDAGGDRVAEAVVGVLLEFFRLEP